MERKNVESELYDSNVYEAVKVKAGILIRKKLPKLSSKDLIKTVKQEVEGQ